MTTTELFLSAIGVAFIVAVIRMAWQYWKIIKDNDPWQLS